MGRWGGDTVVQYWTELDWTGVDWTGMDVRCVQGETDERKGKENEASGGDSSRDDATRTKGGADEHGIARSIQSFIHIRLHWCLVPLVPE